MKQLTNIAYWVAMIGLLFWFAYTKGWIFANFTSITATQAITLLEEDNNLSVLDVRSIEEYKEGHLRESRLIPLDKLRENLNKLQDVKNKKIIVYCRSGNRSVSASRILEENGFTVLNLKGGILALEKKNIEIVK